MVVKIAIVKINNILDNRRLKANANLKVDKEDDNNPLILVQNRKKRIRRKNRVLEIKLFILICICFQALFIYGLMTATTLNW